MNNIVLIRVMGISFNVEGPPFPEALRRPCYADRGNQNLTAICFRSYQVLAPLESIRTGYDTKVQWSVGMRC